jgi:hypothetical protein
MTAALIMAAAFILYALGVWRLAHPRSAQAHWTDMRDYERKGRW